MRALIVAIGSAWLAFSSAPANAQTVEVLTSSARTAAGRGDCATVEFLAGEVHAADLEYFATVFVADPEIAKCHLGEEELEPEPTPPPRPYRRQVIVADLVSMAIGAGVAGIAASQDDPDPGYGLLWGVPTYLFVPPVIHAARRRPVRAILSLVTRIALPLVGAGLGEVRGRAGIGVGLGVGFAAAMVLDWTLLAGVSRVSFR